MIDFRKYTIRQIHQMYIDNELSVSNVINGVLEQARVNQYNEFISLCEEAANMQAKTITTNGIANLFDGIPCAIKDNINYKNHLLTAGSKILSNYYSIYNATVTDKLLANNSIICGKLNMDQFAMGSSNTNSYYGDVLNPYDTKRIPGGSSGGAAAVVASGIVPFALGSDTGGSVRQPAALCNLVGFRPTYGMISRHGVVSLACSLDQIGILTNNVEDNALVFDLLQGVDEHDATSLNCEVNVSAKLLDFDVTQTKIAIINNGLTDSKEYVNDGMQSVSKFLQAQGAVVEYFDMEYLQHAGYTYLGLLGSEITSNLSMFDGIRYGYRSSEYTNLNELYTNTRSEGLGREVKRRLLIGADLLKDKNHNRYYDLLKLRRLISEEFYKIFEDYDYILTPTVPSIAPTFEEYANAKKDYLESQFVEATALAGLPAISIPLGFEKVTKLPFGLQILCNLREDAKVFSLAKYVEDNYEVGEH